MTPATYNFDVVRGTAGEGMGLVFRLKAGDGTTNIPYQDVRMSVYQKSTLLFRLALDNGDESFYESNAGEAEITWKPTAEQTRAIPNSDKGKVANYEIEVWNGPGTEAVYVLGQISGIGGINDDQEEVS